MIVPNLKECKNNMLMTHDDMILIQEYFNSYLKTPFDKLITPVKIYYKPNSSKSIKIVCLGNCFDLTKLELHEKHYHIISLADWIDEIMFALTHKIFENIVFEKSTDGAICRFKNVYSPICTIEHNPSDIDVEAVWISEI